MNNINRRGLRGSILEDMINMTNAKYCQNNLAIIQKIPTPITPVALNNTNATIELAYFGEKSTVDYIGVSRGLAICFDAKETKRESIPLQNIHEHQLRFMENFQKNGGLAFLIVHFSKYNKYYFLSFESLKHFFDRSKSGGRKSIAYCEFDPSYEIFKRSQYLVHYLEIVWKYIQDSNIHKFSEKGGV